MLAACAGMLTACGEKDSVDPFANAPEPPVPNIVPEAPTLKPKAMWIDAHANLSTLCTKKGVDDQLAKIKKYGFDLIYLDVKPGIGYALYQSDFIPELTEWGGVIAERDFDYLGYFLQKCETLGIGVVASASACGWGDINSKEGFVYDNLEKWGPKCQVRMEKNDPNNLVSMYNEKGKDGAMLDPADEEVAALIVRMYSEIVTKYSSYPAFKGISLDYLRYYNANDGYYGMSDANMAGYASYWGESVPKRDEIVTKSGGVGPKFAKWVEYRSAAVTSVLQRIRNAVKAIDADCEIHLWASADWASRYTVGQNWASKKYVPRAAAQYTDTYSRTGFADLLDVFVLGAYTEYLYKKENPSSVWTVENFCSTWNNFIMGDCKCYGSIALYNHDNAKTTTATLMSLRKTDGFMAFELSHSNNGNKWIALQEAFNTYEKSVAEQQQ